MVPDPTDPDATPPDLAARAAVASSVADLAWLLRELRRRDARIRRAPEFTYRQIAIRTGWSVAAVGSYLAGTRLPSMNRLDELVRLLGASGTEQGAIASAWERIADAGPATQAGPPLPTPRMLPAHASAFTGRERHLAELDALLAPGSDPVQIAAITGMAGVGKTALAVFWAHRRAKTFPDGQLYVNLHGYGPGSPLPTAEAVGTLLAGLGVADESIPDDRAARLELYRRLVGGRRLLLVLDNASDAEQVRPLLPGAGCVTVVTSRDDLTGLVTMEPMRQVRLDVLSSDESATLLRNLVGARADREPGAVAALAALCGQLPLALRVAAEHASFRRGEALARLVAEMRAARSGLAALSVMPDDRGNVRAVLSWSLRRQSAEAVRVFHLLGLVPGSDIDALGLAALAGVAPAEGERLAAALERAHLLDRDGHGRYSMHDLVRDYARELAARSLPPDQRRAAGTRLLDYYLAALTLAVDTQFPDHRPARERRHPDPAWPPTVPELPTVAAAAAWLSAEQGNLVRLCVDAAEQGRYAHAIALALAARPFFENGRNNSGLLVYGAALTAAESLGAAADPLDTAFIVTYCAIALWRLGRVAEAADEARRALAEHTRLDNAEGMTFGLLILGAVCDSQGQFRAAADYQRRALELARAAGNRSQEASQLNNLGWVHLHMQDYESAAGYYRRAVTLLDELGAAPTAGEARIGLARALTGLDRDEEALALAEEALAVELEYGLVLPAVEAMVGIGEVYRRQGRSADAVEQLSDALAVVRQRQEPATSALVLNTLAQAYADAGDHGCASSCYAEALAFATQAGDRLARTRALVGLGDAAAATGATARADAYWREAMHAYRQMDLPAADAVAARLRTPDGPRE